jgi:Protein of unknown function (DUF1569)
LGSQLLYISVAMKNLSESSTREEIVRRLKTIQAESPRRWGKMSSHQMVCHLADSFRAAFGEKRPSLLPPNKLLKWAALWIPIRWPHGVPTRPEMDQQIGGTQPLEFDRDRQELLRLLDRFTSQDPNFAWAPHPMFGQMSLKERMRWGYLHMDHHLRQFGA